jgi:hypothetical protein
LGIHLPEAFRYSCECSPKFGSLFSERGCLFAFLPHSTETRPAMEKVDSNCQYPLAGLIEAAPSSRISSGMPAKPSAFVDTRDIYSGDNHSKIGTNRPRLTSITCGRDASNCIGCSKETAVLLPPRLARQPLRQSQLDQIFGGNQFQKRNPLKADQLT